MQSEIQNNDYQKYYVPAQSPWPIVGAVALFLIAVGAGNFVVEATKGEAGYGGYILLAGIAVLLVMLIGWFKNQIDESMAGLYSDQLGRSYRQGMSWFIFSEVMFFAAFFGQAGTAGNINNSMLRLYYLCDDMWQEGFFLCLQVHDENIAQIPKHKLWLVDRMVNVMSIPCTIKGRTFTVPVEADLASSWTKAGVTWKGQNPDKVSTYIDGEKQTFPDYHQAVAAHEASITEKRAFL